MNYFLPLLLFCFFCFGEAYANPVTASPVKAAAEAPTLAVSLAVPEANHVKFLWLSTADPHIDVVVRNISHQPENFYAETCSAGYDTLHLELLSIDGKALLQPIIVQRSVSSWDANFIFTVTLEPGNSMVREVHFTEDRSFFGIPYHGFPAMGAGETHTVRMRAVFEVPAGLSRSKVWTGRAVSDAEDVRVVQYIP